MSNKPKILVFDIETLPVEAYVWQLHDVHIPVDMVKQDFTICSFSAKFVGEKQIYQFDNRDRRDVRDDKALVKKIQDLLVTADVLCSQNGIRFDLPKINSRAYFNHLPAVQYPGQHVDILTRGRAIFGHTSHKLAWITKALDSSHQKSKHAKYPGFDLWLGVMNGEKAAWDEMAEYNAQDVVATEAVFKEYMTWFHNLDLRPFFMANATTECSKCGSKETVCVRQVRRAAGRFRQYQCKECGSLTTMKGAKNNLDKPQKGKKS